MNPAQDVVGTRELCAWPVAPGICWVQTRWPAFTDLLRKRADCRRVACGVAGGYLLTFEIHRPLGFVRRLLQRYLGALAAANEAFPKGVCPTRASKPPGSVTAAARGADSAGGDK